LTTDKTQVVNAALLGERLRRSRKARDMSQADLATMLGLPQSWVSELETGKRPHLDANTLARFCMALDVSADYLLGMTDATNAVTPRATRSTKKAQTHARHPDD
jgi:transcriptional regulator with XRE-family HTH domain